MELTRTTDIGLNGDGKERNTRRRMATFGKLQKADGVHGWWPEKLEWMDQEKRRRKGFCAKTNREWTYVPKVQHERKHNVKGVQKN